MSDGELVIFVAAAAGTLVAWFRWYRRLLKGFSPDCPILWRWLLAIMPVAAVFALVVGLHRWASSDVRNDPFYLALFSAVAGVALMGVTYVSAVIGLEPISDLLERRNPVIIAAIAGIWMGMVALNLGSNMGEGAAIYTSLVPLAINSLIYFGLIALDTAITGTAQIALSEHSWVAAIRLGGSAFAISLPLARAAAGDWVSMAATLLDSLRALPPAITLLVLAWGIERWRPAKLRPSRRAFWMDGVGVAALLVIGGAALAHL